MAKLSLNDLKKMLLFGTKKSIKMNIFLAVTPEKTIPEIADGFNPALNNSLSLLFALINYSSWKEVPSRINLNFPSYDGKFILKDWRKIVIP